MYKQLPAFLALILSAFGSRTAAQTLSLAYQNPDQLAVCASDTLRLTVQNNGSTTLDSVFIDLELPAGLQYLPGSAAGAAEYDVSNPAKPILLLLNQAPGAAAISVQLYASCDLVPAINSAQLFSLLLRARHKTLLEEVATAAFQVQTSLLVITQIDSDSFAGLAGTVVTRTIHVQNTRLGAVKHLFFHDLNSGLISIQAPAAASQQGIPLDFTAYFDGAFFTAFGDGDALLEFGETALIVEEIALQPCLDTMPTVRSFIDVGWSCTPTDARCQSDSAYADIVILPNEQPQNIVILGKYPNGWDHCAQIPSDGLLQFQNTGVLPGENLFVTLTTQPVDNQTGIDPNSLRLVVHGVETPIPASIVDTIVLSDCGVTYAKSISFYIPKVPALDSVDVRFQTYYCSEACEPPVPVYFASFYAPGGAGCKAQYSDLRLAQRQVDNLLADVYYQIGECLQDGQTYDFTYVLQSERLLADSGYLWLDFDLPYGLYWSSDCPPALGGKTPIAFSIDSAFTTHPIQRVRMAFELPLNTAYPTLPFCLRSTCADGAVFVPQSEIDGPDSTGYFTVSAPHPFDNCGHCGFPVHTVALLARYFDSNLDCAWPTCDDFRLRTACERSDCGGDGDGPDACPAFREHVSAGRANFGLPDNNDDRTADAAGSLDLSKIRRDRFLAGDTMRAVLSSKILCGDSIQSFFYQLFTETIRSDFGYAGALDTFEIGPKLSGNVQNARRYIANRDSFQVIQATFTVWDSSAQATYTCAIDPGPGGTDRHFGLITQVNTKPAPIKDEMATMSYAFAPSLAGLAAAGCLPAGLLLEGGDSVQLQVEYKLAFNFTPFSKQHLPPLVNFEMGFLANAPEEVYNYRRFDTLMFQYTGVWDSLSHPQFGIRACEPSTQALPFSYNARIARENLFPFEVRPLNKISDYRLTVPPNAALQSVDLLFLQLQESTPRLQNLPLPYTLQSGVPDVLDVDFGPVYASPPDEGYALRTNFVFAPNCTFGLPARSDQEVLLDWNGCISMPDPDTLRTLNVVGFLSNVPRDEMTTDETVIDFPTPAVGATVFIKNKAPIKAPNYFVEFVNPEGGLSDIEVRNPAQPGQALTPSGGIIQLGDFPPVSTVTWNISARNNSCEPQHLWLIYGWDCQLHVPNGPPACDMDTLAFLFRPQNPEIELNLQELPAQAPLCDSSDYIVFEVSNAELGYAYQPFAGVELPAGFQYVPGSSGIAYPTGSAFVSIPDPILSGGNLLEWNISAAQAAIDTNGLPGVDLKPQNALQIRFRVQAGCGVVSNAQMVFGARAEWSCGRPTNALRKASDPLPVEGLTPTYTAQISLGASGSNSPLACGMERLVSVTLLLSGPGQAGDSIYAFLPAGFTYVPGSYQGGLIAPAGPPQIENGTLRWSAAGLPANALVSFGFKINSGLLPNCNGAVLRVQTRQRSAAFCPVISGDCTVYVATGEATYTFPAADPGLVVASAAVATNAAGLADLTLTVNNNSVFDVPPPVFRVYHDLNGDGQLSAADTLLASGVFPVGIQAGDAASSNFQNLFAGTGICKLLVVLPAAENCDCGDVVYPVDNGTIAYPLQQLCAGQSTLVGIPQTAGHSYTWSGVPGSPCSDCSQFLFEPPGPGWYQPVLRDSGSACLVEHRFSVRVFDPPVLLANDTTVCRGQTLTFSSSLAASWQWSGPGIWTPGLNGLSVQVQESGTYSVIATNLQGCTGQASIQVAVLQADTTYKIVQTCAGAPVALFDTLSTDVPGVYSQLQTNTAGCDSLLFVTLDVLPDTAEERFRCVRDTLILFGKPVTAAGLYCEAVPTNLGCTIQHCITVTDFPEPDLPDPDTFYVELGKSVQLPGPAGFIAYYWAPADSLSCTDCQSPFASPADTTDYTLTVRSADGCTDTLVYRVVPFPPCDPAAVRIPNAFTPNGDGANDVFTVSDYNPDLNFVIERLTIYNRWGQKIYESGGPNTAWDGTADGKPAPADVYVWLLEVGCSGGEKALLHGDVALIR